LAPLEWHKALWLFWALSVGLPRYARVGLAGHVPTTLANGIGSAVLLL